MEVWQLPAQNPATWHARGQARLASARDHAMATSMARNKTFPAPRASLVAALGVATLLGGCADRAKFPSLARRPAEDIYRTARATPPAPPAPSALSDEMAKKLAELSARARSAHATFERTRPSAVRAVSAARGAAKGTENWSVASLAVAQLESARAQAGLPLADLDRLETEASNRAVDGSDADLKAVLEARSEVEALVASETSVIDLLLSQLAG